MNESPNPAGNAVTGNFTLNAQMPNGKTFAVSGYLYDGESVESVNNRVDLFHSVMDRQRLRAEIPELEAKLDQRVIQLGQIKDAIVALEKKQGLGGKLTTQEKANVENWKTSIDKINEDIVIGRKEIADAKAKVGIA